MKYLLCSDGSPKSREACLKVINFATPEDELYFVSVCPPHPKPNDTYLDPTNLTRMAIEIFTSVPDLVDNDDNLNEQIKKSNKKKLKSLDEFNYFKSLGIEDKCPHTHFLLITSNDIPNAINTMANNKKVDCIVLGSTGTGIQKLLIGSVSSQVLQMANCSVLISR